MSTSGPWLDVAPDVYDTEDFISRAENDLAAVEKHVDRLPEPERQKFLSMRAGIAHERDVLEMTKRKLFRAWILQRADELRKEGIR